mgnify:CR=1 FL=1
MSIMGYINKRQIQNKDIVHIHLAYNELKGILKNLSVILSLTWKGEDGNNLAESVRKALDENIVSLFVVFHCVRKGKPPALPLFAYNIPL